MGTKAVLRHKKSRKESVMKCSNAGCSRGIGLIAYRRSWFSKRYYCSKRCRDASVAEPQNRQQTPKSSVSSALQSHLLRLSA